MSEKRRKRIRKILLGGALILIFAFCIDSPVYAAENAIDFSSIWGEYRMDEISDNLDQILPDYEVDIQEVLQKILQGKILGAVNLLWDGIKGTLFNELTGMKNIFASILVLGIVSALFSNFSDMFKSHQIADIGFYFLYLLLMAVLMKAFLEAASITSDTVGNIVLFIKMFIPTYFLAIGAATGAATAAAYYQFTLFLVYGVEKLLLCIMMPLIYSYVLMALMNGIWAEERLTLMLEFLKKGIVVGLKIAMGTITGLSLFQSMITPVIDSLRTSAVKKAISAIPGIGNLAEGVTEMIIGSAVLIKNSVGILMLLLLLVICLVPLAKLLVIACIMKGSAALVGIVSDKRITGCTDRVGDGSLLLFRTTFTSVALFIITIAIVAYTTGKGM
ncbi:MAG: hypothetical protein GX235_05955 [Clostridiales bacterium]|nr:hypothetical protein [Clostridiales bacterium]